MGHTNENPLTPRTPAGGLELWGGLECSLVRVGDTYHDQFDLGGHLTRADRDLEQIASLGIRTLRYPISWERIAPDGDLTRADWNWTTARLKRLNDLGVGIVATLVHHGSGPRDTSLIDPAFPDKLARFAGEAARRFPFVQDWTPVNEPLTTARFSGLYGHWFPHGHDEQSFLRCLLGEIRGTTLAMQAIRKEIPHAQLIQTEDFGKTYSTPLLAYQAQFENERRWLSLDLLAGRVRPGTRLWDHLRWAGIHEDELRWFVEHPCLPDVFGINHYLTSERFLDERIERYSHHSSGGNGRHEYADVEAVRVLENGLAGIGELLTEVWDRYERPVAVTEAHLGCTREEQARWLVHVWRDCERVRNRGKVDVRAVTAWGLLGLWDWDSLLTSQRGTYEPGAFDVRNRPEPRPTALAEVCRALARNEEPNHPALKTPGWWQRSSRLLYPPWKEDCAASVPRPAPMKDSNARPLLLVGADGVLGRVIQRECWLRGLAYVALNRAQMDAASSASVRVAMKRHNPWVAINCAGYESLERAEGEPDRCFRDNVLTAATLAAECARRGMPLAMLGSASVFGEEHDLPARRESDPLSPCGVYAQSKVRMEAEIFGRLPGALVCRVSDLFGIHTGADFLSRALHSLARGESVWTANDEFVSPVYVYDAVNALLDLLLDGASGIWHLFHSGLGNGVVSRAEAIRVLADFAGVSTARLHAVPKAELSDDTGTAYSRGPALISERTLSLLPPLQDALRHFSETGSQWWTPRAPVPISQQAEQLIAAASVLGW